MNINLMETLSKAGLFYIPFLFAICFHEYAHGWVAKKKGDSTADMMGRLTMNPGAHIDVMGTVVLPLVAIIMQLPLFGWAKPVPVNPRNLKNPKKDMFWIALAGPLSNVLLAVIGGFLIVIIPRVGIPADYAQPAMQMLQMFIFVNFLLALFNMIPLHPLDGGKVLARFLPANINRQLEDQQMASSMVLMGLFIFGAFHYLAVPVRWLTTFTIGMFFTMM